MRKGLAINQACAAVTELNEPGEVVSVEQDYSVYGM